MRKFFSNLIFLIVLLGIAYYFRDPLLHLWSQVAARVLPCQQPMAYSIGAFDDRFGISKDVFLRDIQKAESIWEKSIEKQLFVYKPDGALKINLIYDERQIATQKLQKLGISIDDSQSSYNMLKTKYDVLLTKISVIKKSYAEQSATFDSRQAAYVKEVVYWNKRDRATQEVYDRLTQEKAVLDQLLSQLQDIQNTINANVDELNALAQVVNRLAKSLNVTAGQYNTISASHGGEFEEGEYVRDVSGSRINIYQFDDQTKLIRVLTHEMGHAIGLGHLENPKAIMYRLNNGVNESLTVDDLEALKKQCGIKQN